jgi:hypothetical protein
MAHFMGVGGAAKLINTAEDNPQTTAAHLFPNAAAANRSIFYDRAGRARGVGEVYSVLSARYAGAANSPATQTALAMFGAGPSAASAAASAAAAPAIDNAVYLSTFPDVRSVSEPAAVSSPSPQSESQSSELIFRSLFLADGATQPLSPTVRALWGHSSSLTANAASGANTGAPAPLDLFSDRNGTFSG